MAIRVLVWLAVLMIVTAVGLLAASIRAGDTSAPRWSRRRLRFSLPAGLLLFTAAGLLFAAAANHRAS